MLAAIVVSAGVAVAIHLHIRRRLQINWRGWLTQVTTRRWLHAGRQYQLGLLADECDNPDGRIAEDIRVSTELAVEFAQTILQCILQLITFLSVLWVLSGTLPIKVGTFEFSLPGYMVWAAVLYALFGSILTYALGRGLIAGRQRAPGPRGRCPLGADPRPRECRGHRPDARRGRRAYASARRHGRPAPGLARPDARAGQPCPADQRARLSGAHRAADRGAAALSRRRAAARRADADRAGLLQRAMGTVVADRQLPALRRLARLRRPCRAAAHGVARSRGHDRDARWRAYRGDDGRCRSPGAARGRPVAARRRGAGGRGRGRDPARRARADPRPVGQRQEHDHARHRRCLAVGARFGRTAQGPHRLHAAEALFPAGHPARGHALSAKARRRRRR